MQPNLFLNARDTLRNAGRAAWGLAMLLLGVYQAVVPAAGLGADPAAQQEAYAITIRPLLKQYCFRCHGEEETESELNLAAFATTEEMLDSHSAWVKVQRRIASGEMPPKEEKQPSAEEKQKLAAYFDGLLNSLDCSSRRNPGQPTIRRLNRFEYRNTVRDLTGVDYPPADAFPGDDVGYGFDNIGDVLSLPPLLLEKYLEAAKVVSQQAIVAPGEGWKFRQSVAGAQFRDSDNGTRSEAGSRVLFNQSEAFSRLAVPEAGKYEVRVRVRAQQAGDETVRMALRVDGQDLLLTNVDGDDTAREFTARLELAQGERKFTIAFLNDFYDPDNPNPKRRDRNLYIDRLEVGGPLPAKSLSPSRLHREMILLNTTPPLSEAEAIRRGIKAVASRAFRRPATASEIDRYANLVQAVRKEGGSYEEGMRLALEAMLISPSFLFKTELPLAPGQERDLNDHELAQSLSYFLAGSMPDDELAKLADSGELRQGDQLERQVRRLLAGRAPGVLAESFALQWLGVRRLEDAKPDPALFPAFNESIRQAMREETRQFLVDLFQHDRSVLEILRADYTFVNQNLAAFYGLADRPAGEAFQKASLRGTPRRGVLTHASVLVAASNPTRTSPVKRGKWVLENLLGEPPPPPSPDAMTLEQQGELKGTLRQRTEQHRADPRCATCHRSMDPIGFALENFDAIGQWRDREGELPIDASGELPGGKRFNGALELQGVLLAEKKEAFARCFVEKLLTYALGRGLEYYDRCAVNDIVAAAAAEDYRVSKIVLEIVRSEPFQRRRGKKEPPQAKGK